TVPRAALVTYARRPSRDTATSEAPGPTIGAALIPPEARSTMLRTISPWAGTKMRLVTCARATAGTLIVIKSVIATNRRSIEKPTRTTSVLLRDALTQV